MAGASAANAFSGGHHYSISGAAPSKKHGGSEHILDQARFARSKPESIEKLCRTTRFNKEELQIIYRGFKQQCPTGFLREETLKNVFASFFPQGDSSEYAHYVFLTLDSEKTGSISFEKFILTLSLLSRGTIEEKLHWVFQLYDVDGDGYISKDELTFVATSIYHLMGKWTNPLFSPESVVDHIDGVLKRMSSSSDGYVSFPNFLNYCLCDRTVIESMKAMDTAISSTTAAPQSPSAVGPVASNKFFGPGTSVIDTVVDESPSENDDQVLPAITVPTTSCRQRHSADEPHSVAPFNPLTMATEAATALQRARAGSSPCTKKSRLVKVSKDIY